MGRLQLLSVEQNRRIRGLCLWTLQLALPADVPWALVAAGLFLANGAVFGELLPLGIPYIAALRASGPREGVALPAAAVMLSIIWTVGFWAAVPYIIPILVLSLATIKSARSGTAKQIWLLAALTAFAGKTVLALLMRPTVGILLSGVTEAVVGALAYALLYPLLDGQAERDLAYRETQWLLVILAATAAFDGVLWGISIRLFLSFFLIAGRRASGRYPLRF